MRKAIPWSRILGILGSTAMLVGAFDPLEGAIIIVVGSGLILLETWLNASNHNRFRYWLWVFILIAFGFSMMWILTAFGGIGGSTGRSMWWGLLVLPYPVGWIMGIISLMGRLVSCIQAKRIQNSKG